MRGFKYISAANLQSRSDMRFRPCIDIHNGKVKQIVGSTLRDGAEPVTNFESPLPPSHFAGIYRRDRLDGGHVIMLGRGNEAAAVDALKAFPGGLQAGGGITPENAALFLDAGASHVIVTSYLFRAGALQWNHLAEMERAVGKSRLVLDLSCRKRGDGAYAICTDQWQKETGVVLSRQLFDRLGDHCDEFLIHAAHVEGMRRGIDRKLVGLLGECAAGPVTYAGGVRSIDDLESVAAAGGERVDVTVGSALDLFGGELEYRKVVEWFEKRTGIRSEGE
ncbi:MAG: phosphoribosylformimino-5-aminoimidazole carboxamide ribotide isomerase [Chitinispirillaceae bacterium]|nr:phosphoribosylformimino-5-aminoimidazole carboxamide ribotide isomerase [Chitinispirillaceae bacterium]